MVVDLLWSFVACFGVRVLMKFSLMCVSIILVWFGLLSGHLLVKSCLLGLPYVPFVFLTICSLSDFPFWV